MNQEDLTLVKMKFEKLGENTTKVKVNHVGWKNEKNWYEAIKWHEMAWPGVLNSLKSALEKGEGDLCCQPE